MLKYSRLGAVAALVGRGASVHVEVANKYGPLREALLAELAAVGQLVPGRVGSQDVTCTKLHIAQMYIPVVSYIRSWQL